MRKLLNGKSIKGYEYCFACRNGQMKQTSTKIISYLGQQQIKTIWKCQNCNADSIRHRTT